MKKETLYNMILPVWLLIFLPQLWLVTIPINFIIDSLVLGGSLTVLKICDRKKTFLKCIFRVWICGFLADFVGAFVMIMGTYFLFSSENSVVGEALMWNPFNNTIAVLWTTFSIIIAGIFIYFFDKTLALKKADISEKEKTKISMILAIVTTPYLMFFPTEIFF